MKKILYLFFLPILICSCEDYSYKGAPHLMVTISDGPALNYSNLYTSVDKVEIYGDEGWKELKCLKTPFDLMLLTGKEYLTVVDEDIDEGFYTAMRITFGTDNKLMVKDSSQLTNLVSAEEDLQWIGEVDFEANNDDIIVASVDVDIEKSVSYDALSSNYLFYPRKGCGVLDAETAGAFFGAVVDEDETVITSLVEVEIMQNDSLISSTFSNTESGKVFYRLPGGEYDLKFIPRDSLYYSDTTYSSVIIENACTTSLGEIVIPDAE